MFTVHVYLTHIFVVVFVVDIVNYADSQLLQNVLHFEGEVENLKKILRYILTWLL